MKKIPLFLLTLHLIFSSLLPLSALAAEQETGSNTYAISQLVGATAGMFREPQAGDVVTISTAEELSLFSAYVNSGAVTDGITFLQTADITLNPGRFNTDGFWYERDGITYKEGTPAAFTPVGRSYECCFRGTFDGNGYRILGMYIPSEESHVGFFGYVGTDATLLNVSLAYGFVGGTDYVGGVVGVVVGFSTVISHCTNENFVTATGNYVGGIVGSASSCRIYSCTNKNWIKGDRYVGGIAGRLATSTIQSSLNTAVIRAHTATSGGIVGDTDGRLSVQDSLGIGRVVGPAEKGAIAGYAASDAIKSCFYADTACELAVGSTTEDDPAAATKKTDLELKSLSLVREMNSSYIGGLTVRYCHPWTMGTDHPIVSATLVVAQVTTEGETFTVGSLADAATLSATDATIKLIADRKCAGGEMAGSFTIDLNGYTLQVTSPLILAGGKITLTDSSPQQKGAILAPGCDALILRGATLELVRGSITSQGGYAIKNEGTGLLQLSAKTTVKGQDADIFLKYAGTLSGSNNAAGDPLTVTLGFTLSDGMTVAKNATAARFRFSSLPKKFEIVEEDGALVARRIPISPLLPAGICTACAAVAVAVLLTIRKTRKSAK